MSYHDDMAELLKKGADMLFGKDNMNKWCEHIQKSVTTNDSSLFYVPSGNSWCEKGFDDRWQFCPICGTPRPEKKKLLWEKMWESRSMSKECAKSDAKTAKEWAKDLVDEVFENEIEEMRKVRLKQRIDEG